MDIQVIVGFVVTAVLMAVFMVWTWHELRRVDQVVGPRAEDDDGEA